MNKTNKPLIVYQYPKCSTCRAAVKTLGAMGRELDVRHIVEAAPSAEEMTEIVKSSGLPLKKFFNTSGDVYRSLGLKDKLSSMSDEEQIKLLVSDGMLMKRPLVTDGEQVTVGYKEEEYERAWRK
ncbi:arsenate reductase family protein [Paenibacillus sp. GCM10023252]|uniref:arsenate reductase family protein n=1 Tax=Paenibacillus sp. GCM10023252 TaxID=3252649 RepID=UPI00361B2A43